MSAQTLKGAKPIAHGIDIVELSDFYKLVEKLAFNHLHIYFTNNELVTAGNGINRNEKLASRFAIKEAVLKSLGKGWGDGIAFTDIEVVSMYSGAPSIKLHRSLVDIAKEQGITDWLVSTSHTNSSVIASVIAI